MNPTTVQIIGAIIFVIAILHTFSASFAGRLAHIYPAHSKLWHLFSEVEAVFGFWAIVLIVFMMLHSGHEEAVRYLGERDYTEPMFVFAIMVVAASRPVMQFAAAIVRGVSGIIPLTRPVAVYFTVMMIVPLLGSLITEPAAMTLAAFMLKDFYYSRGISSRLMYVTIGTLFVNVSIGGTLTSFAAPPVLMVTKTWNWDTWYMLTNFGWRSALAILVNSFVIAFLFRKELRRISLPLPENTNLLANNVQATFVNPAPRASLPAPLCDIPFEKVSKSKVPMTMVAIHLFLLFVVVFFSHHPPVFIGAFLLFMGLATAYPQHQDRLILREGLMVALFLAGLVTLGGQQIWWLQNLLSKMSATSVYYGATALTAVTDNAALTYLGSLVEGLTDDFKYAIVAGSVTGGGLTVIANAPNPAGMSILRGNFEGNSVSPLWLFLAALPPTLVTILAFRLF